MLRRVRKGGQRIVLRLKATEMATIWQGINYGSHCIRALVYLEFDQFNNHQFNQFDEFLLSAISKVRS